VNDIMNRTIWIQINGYGLGVALGSWIAALIVPTALAGIGVGLFTAIISTYKILTTPDSLAKTGE
jgi:hypothetical protein